MKEYTIIRGKKAIGVISLKGETALNLLQALNAETALIQDYGTFGVIHVYGFYVNGLEKGSVLPDMCNDELFVNQYGYMAFFKSL